MVSTVRYSIVMEKSPVCLLVDRNSTAYVPSVVKLEKSNAPELPEPLSASWVLPMDWPSYRASTSTFCWSEVRRIF
ncbi:hypothetical protein D3C81_1819850 [compost metagenome]